MFESRLAHELVLIHQNLENENLPEILTAAVGRLMEADHAVIALTDGSRLSDGHMAPGTQYSSHPFEELTVSRSVMEAAVDSATGVSLRNEDVNPSESMGQHGIRSCMAASVRLNGRVLGALYCDIRKSRRELGEPDARNLRTLADCLIPAIQYLQSRDPVPRGSHVSSVEELVGAAPAIQNLKKDILRIAPLSHSVLITGPTGSGKDVVARLLHARSGRKGRFVAVNCAEFPEGLLASELFGHQKGAFSGAVVSRSGLMVAADTGTLFLDEIGNAPADLQAKLLRVLETREVRPVGSDAPGIKLDVRFVFATNRDPEDLVSRKLLLPDLYFRISAIRLQCPSLRSRTEDIVLLAKHFASPQTIDAGAAHSLESLEWPGNVRELKQVVEVARDLSAGSTITLEDVHAALRYSARIDSVSAALRAVETGDLNFYRLKADMEEGRFSAAQLEAILLRLYRDEEQNWAGVARKLGLKTKEELRRFENFIAGARKRHQILKDT